MRADLEYGSIPALALAAGERFGDSEAIVDGELRLSFAGLAEAVLASTRAAIAAGLEPGDRAAVWAPNIYEWIVAALGVQGAGGVIIPLNTRFRGGEAVDIIGRSRARMLLCVNGFLNNDYPALLAATDADLPLLKTTVILRGFVAEESLSWGEYLEAGEGVGRDRARARIAAVGGDDLSDIIFTSGTTGRPKGAMSTHAQTLRVFETWADVVGLRTGDRYLVINPFFHTFGYKAGWVACLIKGATIIPQAVFDVAEAMTRIEEEGVTVLPGPPTLFQSILDHPERDDHDLSSLRLAVTGGAVVPVELIRRMREELTFHTVVTGYGLTESTGTVTLCRPEDDPETIALTSGRAIPDTEVRVVGDDGRELRRGEAGEVVTRGYHVMRGYLDDEVATSEAIDADGWLHTGDIGVMDEAGYLRITDRKKDMFIVGGFNAYPAEIEGILLRHPSVSQAAVIGVPDDRLGEVGMAFVVPRAGQGVDAAELISWAREQMANYKVPRRVEVVDALPLNASGKVLKTELRSRAARPSS
ncbi:MAG: FadD3 family acyl-CoA ligase [Acidimicrobiales bacterium]